ncbi:2-oxoacid:acceptor oxidoreductase family protein [bacterium]|nr:2-oxoacid:acceptor oxidoreductase family protein [bacterium]
MISQSLKIDGGLSLHYPLEIRWHGRGGQGAVTASKFLAETVLALGKEVQSFPQFGSERRGAPIMAFTRISNDPITLYNTIDSPNILIVLDATLLKYPQVLQGFKENGLLLVNSEEKPADLCNRLDNISGVIATVPATKIAIECLGKPIVNTAMFGALIGITKLIPLEDALLVMEKKYREEFSEKIFAGNLEAIKMACKLVQMVDTTLANQQTNAVNLQE